MTTCSVGVVDYKAGNIRSIISAFEHLGVDAIRVNEPADFVGLSHLVLPGVGAYGYCLEKLENSGLLPSIVEWALSDKRPLFGICVGMQLLANSSEEYGASGGLGWIGGTVTKLDAIPSEIRIPHVGWNSVSFSKGFGKIKQNDTSDFYFDHSFAFDGLDSSLVVATCDHGRTFPAIVRRDNIIATQFHPEKSQKMGLLLLESFLEMNTT